MLMWYIYVAKIPFFEQYRDNTVMPLLCRHRGPGKLIHRNGSSTSGKQSALWYLMCTCWCPFFPSSNTSSINSHTRRAYNSGQPTPPSSSTYSSACSWKISPSTGHIHSSTILNSTGSIKNTMSMYILCRLLLHMPIQWSSYWGTWSLQESGIIYWLSLHHCFSLIAWYYHSTMKCWHGWLIVITIGWFS